MNDYLDDLFDSIDAAMFSGDSFHTEEAIKEAEYYIERWKRELERNKMMIKELENEASQNENLTI